MPLYWPSLRGNVIVKKITGNFLAHIGIKAFAIALVLGASAPALAGYQEGVDAYNKKDFQKALSEWLPLAEGGNPVAQNSVGALYNNGLGVLQDNAQAFVWYSKAAEQNFPLAMRNLANLYATGHGVAYDLPTARMWYSRAAVLGDSVSAEKLKTLEAMMANSRQALSPSASANLSSTQPARVGTNKQYVAPLPGEPAPPSAVPVPVVNSVPLVSSFPGATDTLGTAESRPASTIAPMPAEGNFGNDDLTTTDLLPETPKITDMPNTTPPTAAASAPAPAPASKTAPLPSLQQAAAPTGSQSKKTTGNNWLIGKWQGPSLGCPPGGGIEFTPAQALSYFNGKVAVALKAKYAINGDKITVTTIGIDNVGQDYVYQAAGPDGFIIASVPPSMPKSMIGAAHKRCDAQSDKSHAPDNETKTSVPSASKSPVLVASPPTMETSAIEMPSDPLPSESGNDAPALPAGKSASATPMASSSPGTAESAKDGWAAFDQGNYSRALEIWSKLAKAGDNQMQTLVGSIYDYGQGIPQNDAEALKWYMMAANKGYGRAQYFAGALYAKSPQIPQDLVESYKWLWLAGKSLPATRTGSNDVTSEQANALRREISAKMDKVAIAKAEALAKNWHPK